MLTPVKATPKPSLWIAKADGVKRKASHALLPPPRYFSLTGMSLKLLFAAILLIGGQTSLITPFKTLAFETTASLVNFIDKPIKSLATRLEYISTFFATQKLMSEEVVWLKEQNENLLKWKTIAHNLAKENQALKKAAHYIEEQVPSIQTVAVAVVYHLAHAHYLILQGGRNSLCKDQVVITARGLLGRIIEVGPNLSRVLLLTDINSKVPVVIEGTNKHAIISGTNSGLLKISRWAQQTTVKLGTRLVTSGEGGIFPSGLPVAEVVEVTDATIYAKPLASVHESHVMVHKRIFHSVNLSNQVND